MHEDYEKLFNKIDSLRVPENLFAKVMSRLEREQRFFIMRRLIIFSISTIASTAAFIFTFQMLQTEFAESGFFYFFSLLFSDFGIIASYWKNFLMSLLGVLPATSLILFLGSILILINSLKWLINNIKNVFRLTGLSKI